METEEEMMAAVLHDVVEDTEYTLDDLSQRGCPASVVEAVDCLTQRADEPYEDYLRRVQTNPVAVKVKLADLQDNMNLRRLLSLRDKDVEQMRKYMKAWRGIKGV